MPIFVEVSTRESVAAKAPRRWREQYGDRPEFRFFDGRTVAEMMPRIDALGAAPTPEDVVRVLNKSWVSTDSCDACGSDDSGPRLLLSVEHDGSDRSMRLCEVCGQRLRAAITRALAKFPSDGGTHG